MDYFIKQASIYSFYCITVRCEHLVLSYLLILFGFLLSNVRLSNVSIIDQ